MKLITITAFYNHEIGAPVVNIEGHGEDKIGEVVDFVAGDLYNEEAEVWLFKPITKIVARYDKETNSVIIELLGDTSND